MTKRVQPPHAIQRPEDVEPFDIRKDVEHQIGNPMETICKWLNNHGIPYLFITTLRIDVNFDGQGVASTSGVHNVRSGELSPVRDFALRAAHSMVTSNSNTEMGTRLAELGSLSTDFMDAFFAQLEKQGLAYQVNPVTGPDDGVPPVTH